jgi:glycosyltransferase involved in cell wall biosynthesis
MTNKIPVSAVVVTYNEALFLEACLKSISFCDEIVVIDLGSKDKSVEIAKKYATKVIHHERVPVVEIIHAKIREFVRYEWVLITDPDEVVDKKLQSQLIDLFNNQLTKSQDIGAVIVPWVFYFKNKRLFGTVWGGINKRVLLVNINRFNFSDKVHRGRRLANGYKSFSVKFDETNVVHHYWMSSYKQLIEKHKRYIRQEGKARYDNGLRTKIRKIIKIPFSAFKQCFYVKKGHKDGFVGFFLSLFWSWYSLSAELNLYKYQKKKQGRQKL